MEIDLLGNTASVYLDGRLQPLNSRELSKRTGASARDSI
jgi:hypothetical protein